MVQLRPGALNELVAQLVQSNSLLRKRLVVRVHSGSQKGFYMPIEEPGTGRLGQAGPQFSGQRRYKGPNCFLLGLGIVIILLLSYWLYLILT